MLDSTNIFLRLVGKDDAFRVYLWELSEETGRVTQTQNKVSLELIYQLIEEQQDFITSGHTRFMICLEDNNETLGTIDLYDFNQKNRTAYIGILIAEKKMRRKGYARQSIIQLHDLAFQAFELKRLKAKIQSFNSYSIALFEGLGYTRLNKAEKNAELLTYEFQL